MAESLINSIARLRVIEKKLLSKELVSRLLAAPTYQDALRTVREAGFGSGFDTAAAKCGDELEGLVTAHLSETYSLVSELMPERLAYVTEVFRMRHDLTNLKLLYKLRLLGGDLESAELDPGGIYDEKALREAIASAEFFADRLTEVLSAA